MVTDQFLPSDISLFFSRILKIHQFFRLYVWAQHALYIKLVQEMFCSLQR